MADPIATVYPELRGLTPAKRAAALRSARRAPLDAVELLGVATSLIVAMLLSRYAGADLPVAAKLAIAVAGLAVTVAPFLVRRTRRGLRRMLDADAAGEAACLRISR